MGLEGYTGINDYAPEEIMDQQETADYGCH
jgi:hypothetical protein